MKRSDPSAKQYVAALKAITPFSGKQKELLRVHYRAQSHAMTARRLAEAVGYKSYRGINLQYGLLAKRIGVALGLRNTNLSLLAHFVPPKQVTNKDWILLMNPTFADALKKLKWV